MRYYGRFFVFAFIAAYVQYLNQIFETNTVAVIDLLKGLSMGGLLFHSSAINYVTSLFPMIILQLCFSTYIYHHYSTASVYYFSRQESRIKWYFVECRNLYAYVFAYTVILILSSFLIAMIHGQLIWDHAGMILIPYFLLQFSLWNFSMVLLINILAIKVSNYIAFFIVFVFQCIQIGSFRYFEGVYTTDHFYLTEGEGALLQFVPIAHNILGWHSSENPIIEREINELSIHFPFRNTLVLFSLITGIVIAAGAYIVSKHDILQSDKEIES